MGGHKQSLGEGEDGVPGPTVALAVQNMIPQLVFPLTLWLIGECPNFLETVVPQALKRRLCALNFVPIQHESKPNVIFPLIF